MAKKRGPNENKGAPEQGAALAQDSSGQSKTQPELTVLRQYIKDLSFESPKSPNTLMSPGYNPQLRVEVKVGVTPGTESMYEVTTKFEAHTSNDAGVIYHMDLAYCGLIRLRNVPAKAIEPTLWVDCPAILFPFLRQIVASVTGAAGYPPLMLDPVNFAGLYAQKLAETKASQMPTGPIGA
jgi:preprotein translocase subunit SecB